MSDFEGKDWFGEEQPPGPAPALPRPAPPPASAYPPSGYPPPPSGYPSPYGYPPPRRTNRAAAWWIAGGTLLIVAVFAFPAIIAVVLSSSDSSSDARSSSDEWVVGKDIQPGVYRADATNEMGCYWARRRKLGGRGGIISADTSRGQAIVEIVESDVGFTSVGCRAWEPYVPPEATVDNFDDGDWAVGEQVEPGTYVADDAPDGCYWEQAIGFRHDLGDLRRNQFLEQPEPQSVTLDTGERFSSKNCGTWRRA